MDGEQDLEKAGADSFIIVTSALHTEFDKFKDEYKQYTRRGFSMLPKNELLHYWNETRASPSSSLDLFSNTYFLLECSVQKSTNFVTGLKLLEKIIIKI